ncbi:MAG: hypothetical protein M1818_006360 [Claussenomyces sp. TS43310]|nr:MAG: hypothetical protein M1818_006360 [Claussenomyces sp. TS43310]
MNGFVGAVVTIARTQGIRGFFNAVVPTMLRQSSNAAVKFGSYTKLKEAAQARLGRGEELGVATTTFIGSLTGVCSVFTTQPLDVIKTRMQSLQAKARYGNTLNCVRILLRDEGASVFWSGAVQRLARLSMASAIMFPV